MSKCEISARSFIIGRFLLNIGYSHSLNQVVGCLHTKNVGAASVRRLQRLWQIRDGFGSGSMPRAERVAYLRRWRGRRRWRDWLVP